MRVWVAVLVIVHFQLFCFSGDATLKAPICKMKINSYVGLGGILSLGASW
jgi:hypothetical protein